MFYTYILESLTDQTYYIGWTENLKRRFVEHNSRTSKYSSKKAPFKLVWYGAFLTKQKAINFEKYLKTGSGFAFKSKRLV